MSKKSTSALESALAWMEKHAAENLDLGSLRQLTTEIAKNHDELKELAVKLGLTLDKREKALKKLKVALKAAKLARKTAKRTPSKVTPAPIAAAKPLPPKKPAPTKKTSAPKP